MSFSAKPKKIYFALYEGVQLLDVAGPAEVFSQANGHTPSPYYDLHYVSNSDTGRVKSSAGLILHTDPLPDRIPDIHTLLIPGANIAPLQQALEDNGFVNWLGKASKAASRKASVCSGAFFLGELGLLDNHCVTTHWSGVDALQARFPAARVEKDTLYINEAELWTSAGVLSGVDMALAILAEDLGAKVALNVARELVVFMFRDGGQSQFSSPIDLQTKANRSDLVNLIAWLEGNLKADISVEKMADHMAISVRTLHRRCLAAFDMTPAKLLSELRLEQSRNLLQEQAHSIKRIAHECGYSNPATYSKSFTLRFGISPQKYRLRFQA